MNSKQKSQRQHSPGVRAWIEMSLEMDTPAYQEKTPAEKREFEAALQRRERGALRQYCVEADARVILLSCRMGVVTPALWDRLWEGSRVDTKKFRDAVDPLWRCVFGYDVPRSLRTEKERVIGNWLRRKTNDPALPVPQRSHFEEDATRRKEQRTTQAPQPAQPARDESVSAAFNSLADSIALVLYAKATPDRQAEMRHIWQSRGWTHLLEVVGHVIAASESDDVDPEWANPEWADHADQVRIDQVAGELLAELDI